MDERNPKTGQVLAGNTLARPGSRKGARNRLQGNFVAALSEHFEEIGSAAIDIVFKESPKDYLKIIASVLPREFILEDGRLETMSDEEIADHLAEIRRLRTSGTGQDRSGAGSGAIPSSERKQLKYYRPYAKQSAFHEAGLSHRERLFMAGNQLGKTIAGGYEAAMHSTGRYPDWWKGKTFDEPGRGVVWLSDGRDVARQRAAHPARTARPAWHRRHSERCHRR